MSATYQRTSTPEGMNINDKRFFSRQYIRPLTAEVTLDVINKALGTSEDFTLIPDGTLAIEVGSNSVGGAANRALEVFGQGTRESVCDCDRRTEVDLRQAMFMMNDALIHAKIAEAGTRDLLKSKNEEVTRQLYLKMLGREPTESETETCIQHFEQTKDRETAFDDIVWSLLNSREFLTNH